jgi:hypothetical protein
MHGATIKIIFNGVCKAHGIADSTGLVIVNH